MKQYCLALAALAGFGTNVCSGSEVLPPPYLAITVEMQDIEGTRVEVGKSYTVYISPSREGSYSALLVGDDGLEVHSDVPVQVEKCDDTSLRWPDISNGRVRTTSDPAVAQLVVFPVKLNPCILALDLPVTADGATQPARPNPGIPN